MKKITLLFMMLFMALYGHAQTTLEAGDIAFLGTNADAPTSDEANFAFVLLRDIDAATQIIFTDRGWNDNGGFSNFPGDGQFTWTSGSARSAGSIIRLDFSALTPTDSAAYATLGDQLFAIQGSIANPTFIAGLHFNVSFDITGTDANWEGAAINNSTSALPNALINGDTAIRLIVGNDTESDNWRFNCGTAGGSPITGTPAQIRAILHNRANWDNNNSTPFNPTAPPNCTISIQAAVDNVDPVVTCPPTPAPIVAGINGLASVPNLVAGSSATDNVSAPGDIVIAQSPTAGTSIGVGVHAVTVIATDEAGNTDTCMVNITVQEPPSTTLTAGDIAFVGFNLDNNGSFAFVLLRDIIAGTNIKFTDCGVNNPNTINCPNGDASVTWFSPTAMTAGSIVTLTGADIPGASLAIGGDQIFAYQGTMGSPIFISGIHSNIEAGTNDADWDGTAANNDESALPNQLINGVNALRLHDNEVEIDNWQFDCSLLPPEVTLSGSAANISAIVNNLAYWRNNNNTPFNPVARSGCTFNVITSSDTVDPVIANCGPTPETIVADVLGNAAVPDLTGGVVASDDVTAVGDLTIVQSPTAGTTINAGVTTVTLFVTDEAGNTATCTIDVTVVNVEGTTLAAGDIAFIGVNHDGTDAFAFVLLRNIVAGTMINFTDCGVNNPNTISCVGTTGSEDTATWFSPSDMNAGSIVTLPGSFISGLLNPIGDQIFAYQGTADAPTFLAGIHTSVVPGTTNDQDWDGANTSQDTSALPDQLTNGVNAVRLHVSETEVDNWQFDCSLVPGGLPITGTPEEIAAIINDLQYWASNDTSEFVPAADVDCSFNVILDAVPPNAVCMDITVELDVQGMATITATEVDGGSTDDQGIASLSVDRETFGVGDVGAAVPVELTVTDFGGNTATCTAMVTVILAQITVPNVVGTTQTDAENAIVAANLVVGTVDMMSSASIPAGEVISQDPTGGTIVDINSVVNLVVSSGIAQVIVPNVVGNTEADATTSIEAVGLIVGEVTTAFSDTVAAGDVISQDPSGGANVNEGSAVNLVVSNGPEVVSVPDVVGLPQAEAEAAIVAAGLIVDGVTFVSSDTVPEGNVVSQSQPVGTMLPPGSPINLQVSTGLPPVELTITGFFLVDADTNTDLFAIVQGGSFNLDNLPTTNLSVRAAGTLDIESVRLELTGPLSNIRTENVAPYAIFGDSPPGNFNGETFAPGAYTITATPFSADGLGGDEGTSLTINFGFTTQTPEPVVSELILVDADTDQDILTLSEGMQININDLPTTNLDIRAITENTASVRMELSGALSQGQTENFMPFALFGDDPQGDFNGGQFVIGDYNISVRPFAASGLGGEEGENFILNFSLFESDITPPVITLQGDDPLILELNEMYIEPGATAIDNIDGDISENIVIDATDVNSAEEGSYMVTYNVSDAAGNPASVVIRTVIVVVPDPVPAVISYVLVDADADLDIMEIQDGMQINLSDLPTTFLNIRANTSGDVQSVRLELNGALGNNARTENVVPYALFGDVVPDYFGRDFLVGNYTLTATPFSSSGASGDAGEALTISFSIVDVPTVNTVAGYDVSLFPNSAVLETNITVSDPTVTIQQIVVHDMQGRRVAQYAASDVKQGANYLVPVYRMQSGLYIVTTIDDKGGVSKMRLLVDKR